MADTQALFEQVKAEYIKPQDQDFPVSKIRLFVDVVWNAVIKRPLTQDQKKTLKDLIDILNLLDEHKHEPQHDLITAMMPSIGPLLGLMPTLGSTATLTFTTLIPMYQHYLSSIEIDVRDSHNFSLEETLLYYEITIFDQLFLVHLFEQEPTTNLIELLNALKAIVITNAMVYDYHQHSQGKSISFFTFLQRGGLQPADHQAFLFSALAQVKEDAFTMIDNQDCKDAVEFLTEKLKETITSKVSQPEIQVPNQNSEAVQSPIQPTPISQEPQQEVLPNQTPPIPTPGI